jgi:hypothetical protein
LKKLINFYGTSLDQQSTATHSLARFHAAVAKAKATPREQGLAQATPHIHLMDHRFSLSLSLSLYTDTPHGSMKLSSHFVPFSAGKHAHKNYIYTGSTTGLVPISHKYFIDNCDVKNYTSSIEFLTCKFL